MVQIELDKPRHLKFDLAAIRDLEANLDGKPLGAVVHDLSRVGINVMVLCMWAGLKHEDAALNPKLVEKMLSRYISDGKSLRVLGKKLREALIDETGLFRDEDETAEGNAQAEAAT